MTRSAAHDIHIAFYFDGSTIDAEEARANAYARCQSEWTAWHFLPTDEHLRERVMTVKVVEPLPIAGQVGRGRRERMGAEAEGRRRAADVGTGGRSLPTGYPWPSR